MKHNQNIEDCLWNIAAKEEQKHNSGHQVQGYKDKGCYDCTEPCACYVKAKRRQTYLSKMHDQVIEYLKTPLNEIPLK